MTKIHVVSGNPLATALPVVMIVDRASLLESLQIWFPITDYPVGVSKIYNGLLTASAVAAKFTPGCAAIINRAFMALPFETAIFVASSRRAPFPLDMMVEGALEIASAFGVNEVAIPGLHWGIDLTAQEMIDLAKLLLAGYPHIHQVSVIFPDNREALIFSQVLKRLSC